MTAMDRDVALITGASMGIGRELALAFAAGGTDLVLVARSGEMLDLLVAELSLKHGVRVFSCPADLAEPESVALVAGYCREHGLQVTLLVNCAGISHASDFGDLPLSCLDRIMSVNMSAVARLIRHFLPGMVAARKGGIINIASLGGAQGVPGLALYSATKSFVITLSEALHGELRGSGVKVVAVCPGFISTAFMEKAGHDSRRVRLPVNDVAVVVKAVLRGYRQNRMLVYPTFLDFLLVFSQRFTSRMLSVNLSGFFAAARNNR